MAKQNEDGTFSFDINDPDNDYLKLEYKDRGVFINGQSVDGIEKIGLEFDQSNEFARISIEAIVPRVNILADFSALTALSSRQ